MWLCHPADEGAILQAAIIVAPGKQQADYAVRVCVQDKGIVAVAAAKRHTVVLTRDGDVYTWGHRIVTPRRVPLVGELRRFTCHALSSPSPCHLASVHVDMPHCQGIRPEGCSSISGVRAGLGHSMWQGR